MSIILKGNNIASSDKGIGPSEVTNIKVSQNTSSIILSWTNPSNVVINGTTLSTFDHVIIVKNTSRIPSSAKDGTVIYNGKSTTCTDSNVTKNTKYYYRFFVYDTNKLCNNNINMIIESTFYGINPVLKNNSWEQINTASRIGVASDLWKVGDEIDLTLSGTFNETVTLQIWDFNHFDKSDGSGKAGICFGMKNLMKDYQKMIPYSDSDFHYWEGVTMRTTIMQNILKSMPSDLQNVIKTVDTYASTGGGESRPHTGEMSMDKVFLPGFTEVSNSYSAQNITESGQKKFPIFTDNNSRIKKLSNGSGNACDWWTRSQYWVGYGGRMFIYIGNNGDGGGRYDYAHYSNGVCFCFNV